MAQRHKRHRSPQGENNKRTHPKDWQTPFPLPNDTAKFVQKHQQNPAAQNLGLWLERFVTWRDQTKKGQNWIDTDLELAPQAKERDIPMLHAESGVLFELLPSLAKRWEQMLLAYSYRDAFFATPEWRFVVGLGGGSVLETSMTLHRLYGIPIIPGSALKGVARAYAETALDEKPDDDEVVKIFGKPPQATPLQTGEIIFFDAIPCTRPIFKLDIMNPHYPDYYQGNDPPADWQNPRPIYFLTVEATEFLFAVAARRDEGKDYVEKAKTWLEKGLAELGIGAKTAAGYGYFEEVRE